MSEYAKTQSRYSAFSLSHIRFRQSVPFLCFGRRDGDIVLSYPTYSGGIASHRLTAACENVTFDGKKP